MTSRSATISICPSSTLASVVGVELRADRFSLGGECLFAGLGVTFQAGLTTCLLGPSGVGKSTLLRLLAGLLSGPGIGIECSDARPLGGRVAYMAQDDLLLPWLCTLDNVTLGAHLRGETPDRGRARQLLAQVGLGGHERTRPEHLSGGMRQRVALARTLMEERPVVLMDEPFSALDALTRFHLQALAAELLRGRTVMLVTHDPGEALRLGNRIHVMHGRPASVDEALSPPGSPPRDLMEEALEPFTRELMLRLGLARFSQQGTKNGT